MIRSSYHQNNYGEVFERIMHGFKPVLTVELGILDGYSTIHMAKGIKANGRGYLHAYDLFEQYPYKHGDQESVELLIKSHGLEGIAQIFHADAWEVHNRYQPGEVSLLHVDLSNTGETVQKTMELWDDRMCHGGIILFEGGTEERDQIEWMVKYGAPPIKPEIETNAVIRDKYIYGTYLKFPGLTMLLKKR